MLKSFLKNSTLALMVILFSATAINAQHYGSMHNGGMHGKGYGKKAHKKMAIMKKVKLLEILELDEATSDKFLAKYTAWEKKIEAHREKVRNAYDNLDKVLKNNKDNATIAKASNEVCDLKQKMAVLIRGYQNDIKSILNDVQFAKFVLFDHNFRGELQRMIMKRMHGGKNRNKNGRWKD